MSLKKELPRFLIAGFSAVGTDLASYMILLDWFHASLAKAISFSLGSIVAFLVNKFWTFESKPLSAVEVASFIALYMLTLMANVTINQIVLSIFPLSILLAFLMATGTSTVLNFVGMKFWVFRKKSG